MQRACELERALERTGWSFRLTERLVVMTSNHPEQLDPALIRPGRIDKKLMLGYMGAQDVVVDMPQHYFQVTLTDPQALDAVRGSPTDGSQQLRC